jgi:phosphatidylglycerophosphatase A
MKKFGLLLATFFNIGRFPIAPGTLASLVTAAVFYAANVFLQPSLVAQIAAIVIIFIIGIPAATEGEYHFGKKDPRPVVIDEVAGQMVALLLVPYTIGYYIVGFFLFRFFDILKPFPVNILDKKIKGGLGIMVDDIAAGLYALGAIHLIKHFWPALLAG